MKRSIKLLTRLVAAFVLVLLSLAGPALAAEKGQVADLGQAAVMNESGQHLAMATFAGGCFWCMEFRFEKVPGVYKVYAGYTGGDEEMPKYKQVSSGKTGHVEAIRIYYDPAMISFEGLLQVLWRVTDPTDSKGQFVDRGKQYRPVVFYHNARQKRLALRSRAALRRSLRYKKPVTIPLEPAKAFWLAEDYHQDFYKRQNVRFRKFRYSNPRGVFVKRIWGRDLKLDYKKYRPNAHFEG